MARSFTSAAFKVARGSATGRAVRSGNVGRRAKNVAVGRAMSPVWRRLWR